jgi:hypothetical protein
MSSRTLQGQGKKVYYGTSLLLLLLLPFYYSHSFSGREVSLVICAACLAALSCVFAYLQDGVNASGGMKMLFAWSYGAGTILTLGS